MDLLQILEDGGVVDKARAAELRTELHTTSAGDPGSGAEFILNKAGVSLADILKAKGMYFGVPIRELGTRRCRLIF